MEKKEEKPKAKTGKIIRLVETNLDGNKSVHQAIKKIRGIGDMYSNAVSLTSGMGNRKLGDLSEEELKKLGEIIQNPEKFSIPSWMYNRRFSPQTGETEHLTVSKLEFAQKKDIDEMRKLKSYRGVRHSLHLPVRGQRTRGSFRKGKTVGVSKKKARQGKK